MILAALRRWWTRDLCRQHSDYPRLRPIVPLARGAALMGEAGPEAVMPLQRDSDGRLGLYGPPSVRDLIRREFKRCFEEGLFDEALAARYGMKRPDKP